MNTIVSKSFGLALLLAVGILAVMVAMGTFSAPKAGADVLGGTQKPTVEPTTFEPDDEDFTLTVTFQITEAIADAGGGNQDVTVTLPTAFVIDSGVDNDDIRVEQDSAMVGDAVVDTAARTVVIGVDDDGDNPNGNVQLGTVVVIIPEVSISETPTNYDTPLERTVTVAQGEDDATSAEPVAIYDPDDTITGQSAELDKSRVNDKGVTMTLKFTTPVDDVDVIITLPKDYQASVDGTIVVDIFPTTGVEITAGTTATDPDTVTIANAGITADEEFELKLGPDSVDTSTDTATSVGFTNPKEKGTFTVKFAQGDAIPAVEATFEVVPPVSASVTTNKKTADTATRLTIVSPGETLGKIGPGDDIVINLKGFGLPSSIDTEDVTIDDGTNTANPSEVTISGDNVTLLLGKFTDEVRDEDGNRVTAGNSHTANVIDEDDEITITIRERAGIKTPTKAGDEYKVKVDAKDPADTEGYDIDFVIAAIERSLSVKPAEAAARGTEITITGKGFTDGGSTVKAGDKTIGRPAIENGSFELIVNNNIKVGGESAFGKGADGTPITAEDGAGDDATAKHVIKAAFTISPESPNPGQAMTITLMDVETTPTMDNVKVSFAGGAKMPPSSDAGDDKDTTWKITVPSDVRTGTIQVSVTVGDEVLNKNVTIATNPLTVSPSTALVGQEVTVTGSGFSVEGTPMISVLTIGGVNVLPEIAATARGVASGGRVVVAFPIPNKAALSEARDYTISVKDDGGRVGTGTVTIPERTLTVDPTEGRIGSTINLSGAGWPTGTGVNLVGIYYDGQRYTTATSDSSGNWSASMTVPNDAGVGMTHKVAAKATVGAVADNVTKEVDHKTPDAVVTLSSGQAQRGTTITVSGENFNIFEAVKIEIGESDVTPAGTTTDGVGSFTVEVLVPGQALGNKNLKVTVKGVPVVEFLEIVSTPVVTTKTVEEVFGDLIDNDSLTTVWRYDFATRTWTSYTTNPETSFGNDLFELDSGDILYVHVSSDQSFSHQKGETLMMGWSLITLN